MRALARPLRAVVGPDEEIATVVGDALVKLHRDGQPVDLRRREPVARVRYVDMC